MDPKILKQTVPKAGKVQIQELLREEKLSSQTPLSSHDPTKTTFHKSFTTSSATEPSKAYDSEERPGKSSFLDQDAFLPAEDVINKPEVPQQLSTIFKSYHEARAYFRSLLTPISYQDDTLPQSDVQRRALIGILFQAFKSTKRAIDNERSVRPFQDEVHDNRIVELRLWQLLNDIEATSKVQESIHMACGGLSLWKGHVYRNFAERFNAVRYALTRHKSTCTALLSTPTCVRIADDPLGYFEKSVENLRVNNAKASVIALGKKAKQQQNISLLSPSTDIGTKRKRHTPPLGGSSTINPLELEHDDGISSLNFNLEDTEEGPLPKKIRGDSHPAFPSIQLTQPRESAILPMPYGSQQVSVTHPRHDPVDSTPSSNTSHSYSTMHPPWIMAPITQHHSVATTHPTQHSTTTADTEPWDFNASSLLDAQPSEYQIDEDGDDQFSSDWHKVYGCNIGTDGNDNDEDNDNNAYGDYDDFENLG